LIENLYAFEKRQNPATKIKSVRVRVPPYNDLSMQTQPSTMPLIFEILTTVKWFGISLVKLTQKC